MQEKFLRAPAGARAFLCIRQRKRAGPGLYACTQGMINENAGLARRVSMRPFSYKENGARPAGRAVFARIFAHGRHEGGRARYTIGIHTQRRP